MDLMIVIVCLGVGIAAGMYISSQIMEHVECNRRHKEFKDRVEEWDKEERDGHE